MKCPHCGAERLDADVGGALYCLLLVALFAVLAWMSDPEHDPAMGLIALVAVAGVWMTRRALTPEDEPKV